MELSSPDVYPVIEVCGTNLKHKIPGPECEHRSIVLLLCKQTSSLIPGPLCVLCVSCVCPVCVLCVSCVCPGFPGGGQPVPECSVPARIRPLTTGKLPGRHNWRAAPHLQIRRSGEYTHTYTHTHTHTQSQNISHPRTQSRTTT